jgi:hypothetical protein
MSKASLSLGLAGLSLVFVLATATAQVRPQTGTTGVAGQTTPGTTRGSQGGRQEPCWRVAGVSQQALQKHRQIEESTRSQVEAVCSNTSLSAQQKQQEIRQLHENAKKQMGSLVTPQQEEALRSCRESRGESHSGGVRRTGGGAASEGPCGEMPRGTASRAVHGSEPLR